MAQVYLIHLQSPLGRCNHYLGYSALESVYDRLKRHKSGAGARMLAECNRRNIDYDIVRLWPEMSSKDAKTLERKLKRQRNHKRFCPVCNQHLATDKH